MYGVHDPTRVGELSLEYSIDGTLLRRVDFTNTGSAAPNSNISTVPQTNFPFFTVPALLTLGTHKLTVVVVEGRVVRVVLDGHGCDEGGGSSVERGGVSLRPKEDEGRERV